MMFYPSTNNYDMLCEKTITDEDDNELVSMQSTVCGEYDIRSYAIQENEYITGFENADYFRMHFNTDYKNSSILIDNNFYIIKQNMLSFGSLDNAELVDIRHSSGSKTYIAISGSFHPWFILTRSILIYVNMLGFFRVAYDVIALNNIMNMYVTDSELVDTSFFRLYLEPVPTEINGKAITLQVPNALDDNFLRILKLQLASNKCLIYYITNDPRTDTIYSLQPPLRFATVMNLTIDEGLQQTFNIGVDGNEVRNQTYLTSISVTRSPTFFALTINGQDIFKTSPIPNNEEEDKSRAEKALYEIMNNENKTVIDFNVAFAFNVYILSVLYHNNQLGKDDIFIYRGQLNGMYKDRCFALNPNLNFPQVRVSYSLPSTLYNMRILNKRF
jgi:hypothetical protein